MVFILVSSLLAGCAQGQKDDGKIVIGAAMPIFDDKWLSYLYDAIREYDEQHDDIEVKMVDAKNDSSTQLKQVEQFVVEGVDAIVTIPVETSSVGPLVNAAKNANIPIVVVNRMPEGDVINKIDAYVGSESIQAGKATANDCDQYRIGDVSISLGGSRWHHTL